MRVSMNSGSGGFWIDRGRSPAGPEPGLDQLEEVTAAVGTLLRARDACSNRPQLVSELNRALRHVADVRRALLNIGARGSGS
jgi:hypothetical protein